MTPKTIAEIIHRSIDSIECYKTTETDEHLVALTFLMATGAEDSFHTNPLRHGMMGLTRDEFHVLVYDHIRIHEKMVNDISNICLVDVKNDSFDDLFEALMYNVAFQAVITWCYYRVRLGDMPRDIESAVNAYFTAWERNSIIDAEDVEDATTTLINWLNKAT